MKLNKPHVTENQTELESYVASLLIDVEPSSNKIVPLVDERNKAKEVIPLSKLKQTNQLKEQANQTKEQANPAKTVTSFIERAVEKKIEEKQEEAKEPFVRENSDETGIIEIGETATTKLESSEVKAKVAVTEPTKTDMADTNVFDTDVTDTDVTDTDVTEDITESSKLRAEHTIVPADEHIDEGSVEKQAHEDIKNELDVILERDELNQNIDQTINLGESEHLDKINQEVDEYSKRQYQELPEKDPRLLGVEKLLAKIALANVVLPESSSEDKTATQALNKSELQLQDIPASQSETHSETTLSINDETGIQTDSSSQQQVSVDLESASSSFSIREHKPLKEVLGNVFQTLIFEVNRLPLAVPLVKLGGIVSISEKEITPLVGTPDWFMGLVPHEKGNLMVVDTQRFIMPEQKMDETKEYRFLIILDDSNWALACHTVGEAKNLTPEDIRWSSRSSKRPWFAGMVVEFMSALLEADELINMLADNIVE